VHLKDTLTRLQRNRLTVFRNLGLRLWRPHALAFHIDRTGTSSHWGTATSAAAIASPTAAMASLLTTLATTLASTVA
jgi:hypothetical protein